MYYNPLFVQTDSIEQSAFYATDLDYLHQSIPFKELASKIPSPAQAKSGRGRKAFLKLEGGIALLVLKHYMGLSDEMLIDRLNKHWCMQYFCGVQLGLRKIKHTDLVSWWRCYIARHLDIKQLQPVLINAWKPCPSPTHVALMDATVYESNISYPTDVKLLWHSITKLYHIVNQKRKLFRLCSSRSNYAKHKKNYMSYQRNRRKSKGKNKKLCKQLLKYLHRLHINLEQLQSRHKFRYSNKENRLLKNIQTVYEQNFERLYEDRENIKQRIVSLAKPYVRPIIRGKEVKPVEFDAKVHKVLVGGLSFIEHISYENFHEGTRLKHSIVFHQKHFGKCSQWGANAIYATNENRRYCMSLGIATSFVTKGK